MSGLAWRVERNEFDAVEVVGEPMVLEKLKELTRSGYVVVPDTAAGARGIRLRHESAPDLILHEDGNIELPLGQPRKSERDAVVVRTRRLSWRRMLMVVFLASAFWFFSAMATAFLLAD